jgi:hypothetical protein
MEFVKLHVLLILMKFSKISPILVEWIARKLEDFANFSNLQIYIFAIGFS